MLHTNVRTCILIGVVPSGGLVHPILGCCIQVARVNIHSDRHKLKSLNMECYQKVKENI